MVLRNLLKPCLGLGLGLMVHSSYGLDLLGAYRAALENDATFQSVKAAAGAAREALPQARAQLLPQLSASVTKFNNDTRTERKTKYLGKEYLQTDRNSDYGSSNGTLSLRQPLFRLGSIAAYAQALSRVDSADASEEKGHQDLILRVSSAYFEVLLAHDSLSQIAAQKKSLESQLKAAQRSFQAGQGTRTDIEEAQARYDAVKAQLLAARSQIAYAEEQLQSLIDKPVGNLAKLSPEKILLLQPEYGDIEEWFKLAEASSPELKRLRADVEGAEREVLKAQSGHFPTVDLVVQRSRAENDIVTSQNTTYLNTQLGVQVNIPLFSGGYVSSTVAEARQQLLKVRADYEAARRNLRVQLRQQFQGVADGIDLVQAQEQAVRSAEQAVFGTRKGVQAGTRTLLDVLNAEDKHMTALRSLAEARYRYLIARVALNTYSGRDSVAELERVNQWLTATE